MNMSTLEFKNHVFILQHQISIFKDTHITYCHVKKERQFYLF